MRKRGFSLLELFAAYGEETPKVPRCTKIVTEMRKRLQTASGTLFFFFFSAVVLWPLNGYRKGAD